MSDDLRVRLFIEQVEEVERLLTSKQKAVDDVTQALEGITAEIANKKRLKARHAALAAVAAAKTAQQDAEIKLAEEQLCLLQEQAESDRTKEPPQSVEHRMVTKDIGDDARPEDSGAIDNDSLAQEKLKLANEEANLAKAKELLAGMKFEEQQAKLQDKLRGLKEKESTAKLEHDNACKAVRDALGDVGVLKECKTKHEGDSWPDESILKHPVATVADALKLLQSLNSEEKVRATWDVVRRCQRLLCKPAVTPEEDTESVTEPAAQPQQHQGADEGNTAAPEAGDGPVALGAAPNPSEDGSCDGGSDLDLEKLRATFAVPEKLLSGAEKLQQATDRVESLRTAQADAEARISALLAENKQRSAAVEKLTEEIKKQRATFNELADVDV